ncbi:MAG: ATP synthase F1 subunit gamma [Myxococcota bacterium]|nr:ATP synthase F1 subunit gamma [Myxococcota bacterium]
MASLRDIRTRIKSVKNTQKITGAMKLVAASKLRRAQDAITAARPYALEIDTALQRVAQNVVADGDDQLHPLLTKREVKNVLLVVLTSDRGLCGPFNSGIIRRADQFLAENSGKYESIEVASLGRRGAEHFRKTGVAFKDYPGIFDGLDFRAASDLAESFSRNFVDGKYDAVFLIYNQFKSAINQEVTLQELLPVSPDVSGSDAADYIYEPSAEEVLESLVPRYVATLVWRALLESVASEHGARMTAMDSATKNAVEIADKLTLEYNRARQAAITQELMEIIGGAAAISG